MERIRLRDGITFDDILLIPRRSDVVPAGTDCSSALTPSIRLNIPLLSAPMDTVTESQLAIALAQEGGIGIVHKNLDSDVQAREVAKVKRSENGMISDPITLSPEDTVSRAISLMEQQNVSGFPVTVDGSSRGQLAGILTRRDIKFVEAPSDHVGQVMTKEGLVTANPEVTLESAETLLNRGRIEKLLLTTPDGSLAGLITMRDIENLRRHPSACRDERGRLRVGAAVGVGQMNRVEELVRAEVDVIVVDTAHGHSQNVLDTIREVKASFDIDVIAGNIATGQAARDLIDAGADAVKVGIGPGSICTTRVISGVGVPQLTALEQVCQVAAPEGVPVISDGGIRQSGDIAKAIAFGAHSVMIGSMFAGLEESPGELILHGGRRYKTYRGMGSLGAMGAGSADRYGQSEVAEQGKFVPEGIEGRVPYRGKLADSVYQMVGGLRAAMGYSGCATIDQLRHESEFVRVSSATVIESHPHDIQLTKEAPNYSAWHPSSGR